MAKGISAKQAKTNLRNLELRIKKLNEIDIPVAYENALIENERVIIEFVQEQLASGRTGTGEPTTLYGVTEYDPFTVRDKKQFGVGLGRVTDRITLYMTGAFYEQMYTTAQKGTFSVKSRVPYFEDIILRSGPEVMHLTPEDMESLMEIWINPIIQQVINEALTV